MPAGATRDNPIRTADPKRGGRWCRCAKCGTVELCTAVRDFYQHSNRRTGPIVCESCVFIPNVWDQIPANWRTSPCA